MVRIRPDVHQGDLRREPSSSAATGEARSGLYHPIVNSMDQLSLRQDQSGNGLKRSHRERVSVSREIADNAVSNLIRTPFTNNG